MTITRWFYVLVLGGAVPSTGCGAADGSDGGAATGGAGTNSLAPEGATDNAAAIGTGGSPESSGGSGSKGPERTPDGLGASGAGAGENDGPDEGGDSTVSTVGTGAGGAGSGGSASGSGADGQTGGAASDSTCVDVSHVDERQKDDLRVIGTGFTADEGETVRIVATHGAPSYGLGQTVIHHGSFDVLLPGVLGDYTGIAVHIDRVRDSACNPDDEFIWQWTTGPALGDTVVEVSPDTLRTFDQVGPCSLNGIFDLTTALTCPPED